MGHAVLASSRRCRGSPFDIDGDVGVYRSPLSSQGVLAGRANKMARQLSAQKHQDRHALWAPADGRQRGQGHQCDPVGLPPRADHRRGSSRAHSCCHRMDRRLLQPVEEQVADRDTYLAGSGPVLAAVGAMGHELLSCGIAERGARHRQLLDSLAKVDWGVLGKGHEGGRLRRLQRPNRSAERWPPPSPPTAEQRSVRVTSSQDQPMIKSRWGRRRCSRSARHRPRTRTRRKGPRGLRSQYRPRRCCRTSAPAANGRPRPSWDRG